MASPQPGLPNVILLLIDDLGVEAVDAYLRDDPSLYFVGQPSPMPFLDSLARDGAYFTRASALPSCSPTRATIQTGMMPHRSSIGKAIGNATDASLPGNVLTLPKVLAHFRPEVRTALIGKWHLSSQDHDRFDFNGDGDTDDEGEILGGTFAPWIIGGWPHFRGSMMNLAFPFGSLAPDYFHWWYVANGEVSVFDSPAASSYAELVNARNAIEWLAESDAPFFLFYAANTPHTPLCAPPAAYHTQDLPTIPWSPLLPMADSRKFFDAMLEALDNLFREVVESLSPDRRKNTVLIVLGDNGTEAYTSKYGASYLGTPVHHWKRSVYKGGTHVPLLVLGPRHLLPVQGPIRGLVQTSDLFATVTELYGIDARAAVQAMGGDPADLDSFSVLPYLRGEVPAERSRRAFSSVMSFSPNRKITRVDIPMLEFYSDATQSAGGFKLVRHLKKANGAPASIELYDLNVDPFELNDLNAPPHVLTAAERRVLDELVAYADAALQ